MHSVISEIHVAESEAISVRKGLNFMLNFRKWLFMYVSAVRIMFRSCFCWSLFGLVEFRKLIIFLIKCLELWLWSSDLREMAISLCDPVDQNGLKNCLRWASMSGVAKLQNGHLSELNNGWFRMMIFLSWCSLCSGRLFLEMFGFGRRNSSLFRCKKFKLIRWALGALDFL